MKLFFPTFLLCCLFSTHLKSEDNCFQYVELSKGVKSAIEDYGIHYDNNNMLTLIYQSNTSDSIVFTLIGDIRISSFMESPTMYFSLQKGRIILIYNGEEKDYNPNAVELNSITRFLSHFDKSATLIHVDWDKKELVMSNSPKYMNYFYDPLFVQYHISNGEIINKRIPGSDIDYPKRRYTITFRFVRWWE